MLDDTADVVQSGFRKVSIAIASKQRLAFVPDRLVGVHARAVVTEDRFRHEGCGFAILVCNHVDAVFVNLNRVSMFDQGAECDTQFVLRRSNFVVVLFATHAHFVDVVDHFGTDVVCRVNWRDREVTTLRTRTVAAVAAFEFGAGVVRTFFGVKRVGHALLRGAPTNVVEHEEFRLCAEICGVADTSGFHVCQCAFRGRTRATLVTLAGGRFDNVTNKDQGRLRGERINNGGRRIRHQDHVGFVDFFPTGNRRTVEHDAVNKDVFVDGADILCGVLPFTFGIGKAQIDKLDAFFFDQIKYRSSVRHDATL